MRDGGVVLDYKLKREYLLFPVTATASVAKFAGEVLFGIRPQHTIVWPRDASAQNRNHDSDPLAPPERAPLVPVRENIESPLDDDGPVTPEDFGISRSKIEQAVRIRQKLEKNISVAN